MSTKKEWITVGALGDGFAPDSFILPKLTSLNGKSFTLHTIDKPSTTYQFIDDTLIWEDKQGNKQTSTYRATSVREDFYFVDFLHKNISYSTVLDIKHNSFTTIIGHLPKESDFSESLYHRALSHKELTLVNIEIAQGSLNQGQPVNFTPHQETDELIGIRNLYRYSPTEVYEHIYLNQDFYTWHCISGVEAKLTDTDRCHYYKLDNDLYLFIWREKIIPTLGIVIIDLQQHRSDGKICGYATGEFTQLANFPVSSHCSLINKTTY